MEHRCLSVRLAERKKERERKKTENLELPDKRPIDDLAITIVNAASRTKGTVKCTSGYTIRKSHPENGKIEEERNRGKERKREVRVVRKI